ncbi:orotidine 5'-phosphate decarboxylase / HUMPS family protein [Sodalis-like endosymbiont of Proechinophthirus fluctus]|uniref:orotidine 5'-phosphate decarboxylase / HUMPS family protein n=1 Tax=Sodalis-like endosymbiont of Proechinophthirus fluctus TaxID=1462730 RepID=UPI001FCB4AD2|nr:orotidine 5'-phosphate decarboxylase / HUMPS family protein [Sodalis-like endosymbiont of Proechinophthirus fluctus]
MREYVDIIEIGTSFIITRDMDAMRRFRERFPEKEILTDEKIMDVDYFESQLAFNAGADYITALGVTNILTDKTCLRAAQESSK